MKHQVKKILEHLKEQRGFDFTGNRLNMLERRISTRLLPTNTNNLDEYFNYILIHSKECDKLIDSLTINVSKFFRNPLTWELTARQILPELLADKRRNNDSLRFWSAGCASGEEPYSLAILINDLFEKEDLKLDLHISGTDIDAGILQRAKNAIFNLDALKNVKLGLITKYFSEKSDSYKLNAEIRKLVEFSFFDLLDRKRYSPPGSVFGNFDIVLCRNVLIYFNLEFQNRIFDKLFRSLNTGGYLILGEAEVPIQKYKNKFKRSDKFNKIYQKV